ERLSASCSTKPSRSCASLVPRPEPLRSDEATLGHGSGEVPDRAFGRRQRDPALLLAPIGRKTIEARERERLQIGEAALAVQRELGDCAAARRRETEADARHGGHDDILG